jgi:tRNA (uracil-5-)-methyltransferase TRM9
LDQHIAQRLVELNREFYQTFAVPFSATRQRLQPGVRRLLQEISNQAQILDLGCGNGEFWRALAGQGYTGRYLGLDFSPGLLEAARAEAQSLPTSPIQASPCGQPPAPEFRIVDLTQSGWAASLPTATFDRITAFAMLHHLPGHELRLAVLQSARRLLAPAGRFYHSNWQFLNSPRLHQRIQPWSAVNISEDQVEPQDYLLDWRSEGYGYRYVHHFSPGELAALAGESGFQVVDTFSSDGEGDNLGLYQVWEASAITV